MAAPVAKGAPDLWYRPTPLDANLPWNDHDPWGGADDPRSRGAFHRSLSTSSHSFQSGLKGSGAEVGVRFGGAGFGVVAGKYLPNSSNVVGVDLFSNYGKILYDGHGPFSRLPA